MVFKQYKLSTLGETKNLFRIDDVLLYQLMFQEKMYLFNTEGHRCGRFSINIEPTSAENIKSCMMLVHISNKGILSDGLESGTTVTGMVSKGRLRTFEEVRCEYSDVPDCGRQERRLYLLRERKKYYCSVTSKVCGLEAKEQATIPFSASLGLTGEAANAILFRIIAIRGYEGILSLTTVLSDGKICHNYYVSRLSQQTVNGVKMDVMVIYRNLTDHKNCNFTLTGTLTRAGQMLNLFWSNTKIFAHVDPDLKVYGSMVSGPRGVGLEQHWNKDEQMYSLYLDRKVRKLAEYRSFMITRIPFRKIVADFLLQVIILKPVDVVCFAISYFTAFGHNTMKKCAPREPRMKPPFETMDEEYEFMYGEEGP